MPWTKEVLPDGAIAYTSPAFRIQTDGLRLAAFSLPAGGERVCDLGTGCGCIPLWWLSQGVRPVVDGVDVQEEAVRLAAVSVEENGWQAWFRPLQQDWRALTLPAGEYDRVVCNPPYYAAGRGRTSPDAARDTARRDPRPGMTWIPAAARLLRHGGRLCVCYPPDRLPELLAALRAAGLEPKRLRLVQRRAESRPWLVLCEARKGGRPDLQIEPVWIEEASVCPEH